VVVPAPPDVDEVRRIAGITNPVIRNLEITHCYSRLAAAVAARTGEGANWCTFATWGRDRPVARSAARICSRTSSAGSDMAASFSIRSCRSGGGCCGEGSFSPTRASGRLTAQLHTPFDAFERASDAVARGNRKVFEEIGLEFARYLHKCPPDVPPDSAELQKFLERLRSGDPPDGQRYLRQAFEHYDRHRFETDPKAKTELVMLANLEIGLHEQTRLQPEIREALDASSVTQVDLGRRLLGALFPRTAG
jgi:hypothetical protein